MVCFSGIYLNSLPIGIPHIIFVVSFLYYSCFYLIDKPKLRISFILFFLLFIFFIVFAIKSNSLSFILQFSSLMMFPFILEFGKNTSKTVLLHISYFYIKITTYLLLVECVARYICGILWPLEPGLYRFKDYSFMFYDSNFTAHLTLVLYFFCKYLNIYHNINMKLYRRILFILCFLTISRAGIAALMVSLMLFHNLKRNNNFFIFLFFRCIGVLCIGYIAYKFYFDSLYQADGSFRSKFIFFDRFNSIFVFNWNTFLTGIGIGNAAEFMGRYPHSFFLLYFIEIGIIGLTIKFLYILNILIETKAKGLLVLIPLFIAEQSVTSYSVHYLYVILAVIALLEMKRKNITIVYR